MNNLKNGWKSSELWVGLFTVVFTFLCENLGWDIPKEAIIGTIAWAIAYIFARFGLKMRAVKIEADLKRLAVEKQTDLKRLAVEKEIKEDQQKKFEDLVEKYLPNIVKMIKGTQEKPKEVKKENNNA